MKSLAEQFDALRSVFPDASTTSAESNLFLVRIPRVVLPDGWNQQSTEIRFVVPNGYPYAAPDCFWADQLLRLKDGRMPQNAQIGQVMPGQPDVQTLWFSWHVTSSWNPSTCNLMTYVNVIMRRFEALQ
jgi:hypothetical protein